MDYNFDSSKFPEKVEEPDFEVWDYGHLIRECNRCGHKTIMDRDVEGGINMYLPATDKHDLRLTCENCNNTMRMYFIKSNKIKPPERDKLKEAKSEVIEEKRKRKKIKKNEVSKSSKETKPISSSS